MKPSIQPPRPKLFFCLWTLTFLIIGWSKFLPYRLNLFERCSPMFNNECTLVPSEEINPFLISFIAFLFLSFLWSLKQFYWLFCAKKKKFKKNKNKIVLCENAPTFTSTHPLQSLKYFEMKELNAVKRERCGCKGYPSIP